MRPENHVSYPVLILACVVSVIAAVGFLDKSGKIRHTDDKEAFSLSTYQVIYLNPEQESAYRLSPKPSLQTALCHEGFLFIAADQNPALHGLLVDYKNRGVKCAPTFNQTPNPTEMP